jgi:hypothetical protein
LQELQRRRKDGKFAEGMDRQKLEDYLDEQEFVATFGVSPFEFSRQPTWKRQKAKKEAGIF